ncbi:MAG: NAD(P)H-binding protein [Thermacetogeniaceae bacterium]|jgi:nucleoside-diphosphate-sugar epimerase
MLFITGITGLTGRFLLDALREAGYDGPIRCLVRERSDISWIRDPGVELYKGDVTDVGSLVPGLQGADGVIHLVNIRSSPQIIRACREAGVKRAVFVNTTGIYSKYQKYSGEYKILEQGIQQSGLDYTMIRPTMIYGNQRDKNIHKLVLVIDRYPVVPMIGTGNSLMQPIYAQDLARSLASAWLRPAAVGRAYNVVGKEPVAYAMILSLIADVLKKRRAFVRVPYGLALLAGYVGEVIPNGLLDTEKVKRLREDKAFSYDEAARDLGFAPRPFEEGIVLEIAALRQAGLIR